MARYIDAEEFCGGIMEWGEKRGNQVLANNLCDCVNVMPTADVVPKRDYDILKSLITHKEEEAYNKGYADVVRDIFEEIDSKIISEIDLSNAVLIEFEGAEEIYNRIKGEVSALCKLRDFIAKLKKKYTKSEQKSCENCTYYDNYRKDQPCCSCNDYSNWEREEKEQ